jgi:AcrR family transcriptional regulator
MARPQTISDAQIRDAAREVFVQHGPGASVSTIASRLGVTHAALFSRAGSKSQLMIDSLCPGKPEAIERFQGPLPETDVVAWLVETLEGLMIFLTRVIPNLVVLKASGTPISDVPMGEVPPPVLLRRLLAGWLTEARQAGLLAVEHPEAAAEGLLGAMEARCFNSYLGNSKFAPGDDREFLESMVRALVGGSHE